MSDARIEHIHRMQRQLIGKRYEGVCFNNTVFDPEVVQKLAAWLKNPTAMLIFIGSPGIGKTMFCACVLDWCYGKFPTMRYWNEREIMQKLRDFISSDVQGDYLKELSYTLEDYLIMIDDMGSSGMNDWRREVWLEIIDNRYESQLPTIITSNFTIPQIKEQMGDRIYSRLMSHDNTIIQMHGAKDMRQEIPNEKK